MRADHSDGQEQYATRGSCHSRADLEERFPRLPKGWDSEIEELWARQSVQASTEKAFCTPATVEKRY